MCYREQERRRDVRYGILISGDVIMTSLQGARIKIQRAGEKEGCQVWDTN